MMIRRVTGLALSLMMLGSSPARAAIGDGPVPGDRPIVLAEETLPVSEILHMEPANLVMLGAGIIAGALVIGPYLGVSEVLGVGIGAIAGEALYQSHLLPFGERRWFQ